MLGGVCWSFVIFLLLTHPLPLNLQLAPESSNEILVEWRGEITHYFTWMFVGSRAFFFFFLMFITIKYYNVKLGRPDEKPEFDDFNFFFMIFAAGKLQSWQKTVVVSSLTSRSHTTRTFNTHTHMIYRSRRGIVCLRSL